MAQFEKSKVESYRFYFTKDEEAIIKIGKPYPKVCLGGASAFFTIDESLGILQLTCDWGEYIYRGFPGKTETFKQLLCRISKDYLLRKISSETEINWKKTKREANKIIVCDKYLDKDEKSMALTEINNFNPGSDGFEESFCEMFYGYLHSWDEVNVMVKEYPLRARVAVEVFFNYLVPTLRAELNDSERGG